jgi:SNF2 family DNA or RNA helicase
MVLRRRKDEPEVIKDVQVPEGELQYIESKITREHAAFYAWYLEQFAEWLAEALENEKNGTAFSSANLLVQLQLLMSAATYPQNPKLQVPGVNVWTGSLTTKQLAVLDAIEQAAQDGQKVILFASSPSVLEFLKGQLLEREVISLTFHGDIPMEKRLAYLERFQDDDGVTALLMSRGAGQTGYNIECADAVYSLDFDWTPAAMEQSEARILRSKWYTADRVAKGSKPQIRRCVQLETIDEYMRQMIQVKTMGIGQAVDRSEVNFDWDKDWQSYRQFSINMLKDLGLM